MENDYANADTAVVSAELTAEGQQVASSFARVQQSQWGTDRPPQQRLGVHGPDAAQYFLHDVAHHLADVDG